MPSVHEVTIEPLTDEAFAPFGQIIAAKNRPADFRTESGTQGTLTVLLKYDHDKRPAISEIKRQSKPGLRRYVGHIDIPKVMNGLGIAILSTSKGVMVDREARKQHLGGELIATVW